ncbi:ring-cleaving dioxygenase [Jannaschia seohaensis]|uniref:Glyoxalase family protein n=1 Tax=Jannaschia seohaensis TaxID=475081 RepID=A0A2Y9AVF7_9RHOB|nr:ring-cleaving dioxygenase [Jannaschia seohaensis]PWJ17002.1 glyoxalase family protein [Jannaschia seohaensis]SSA48324.1 glyoxalase family protein [Jannaschia seohaensis]
MSDKRITGLHHVTAISGPPQANVDFFTKLLDQRLVKKTVNFDDPGTYHLYYGNRTADPGTILTFFPFVGARPGRPGPGMASAYGYSVGADVFDHWAAEVAKRGGRVSDPEERFGQAVVTVTDPDGAAVELIAEPGSHDPAEGGFHSTTLWLHDLGPTQRLLVDHMGYEEAGHEASDGFERLRLKAPGDARGTIVDLYRKEGAARGVQGAGTIHHVAFRALDDADQLDWRDRMLRAGMQVTPVIDRQYFNAIYFREPGGVLFEIATDPPGFTRDEPLESLGQALKLPDQYEPLRDRIEAALPRISA